MLQKISEKLLSLREYATFKGLLLSSSYVVILSLTLLLTLNQITAVVFNLETVGLVTGGLLFINFLAWIRARIIGSFIPARKNKINIGIAIKCDPESETLYKKAINTLESKFAQLDEYNNFNIFELPKSLVFTSDKKAEEFILKEGIHLLIWGETEYGSIQSLENSIFQLRFSYNYRTVAKTPEEIATKQINFAKDMNKALVGRVWRIVHPNSLPDLRVVAENLTEVSLYIILRSVASFGFWKLALDYAEELTKLLNDFDDKSKFPNYDIFRKTVISHILDLSTSISYYYITNNDFRKAKNFSLKALSYDDADFASLINLAKLSWEEGNKKRAQQYNKRAKKQQPANNLVRVNNAFFALEEGNYSRAVNLYRKIKSLPEGSNIFYITNFLYSVYSGTNEPSFLFASGYLNFRLGDKKIGAKDLKKFLRLTSRKSSKYKPLRNLAQGNLKLN